MDAAVLDDVLSYIHNWFERDTYPIDRIEDGQIPASIRIPNGAWYRIQGSMMNDGLHQHPCYDLTDEEFGGTITTCAVPNALIAVAEEVEDYVRKYGASDNSPYQSESFGGYSYNKKSKSTSGESATTGWQDAFSGRFRRWRKLS